MLQETWSSYHVSPKHCPQKRQEGEMPWISLQFLKAVILQPGRMIAISWLWSLSQGWTFLPCWKLKELSPQTQRCLSAQLLGSGDQWDQCGDSLHLRRETWNPKPLIDLIGDKKHVKTPLFPYGDFSCNPLNDCVRKCQSSTEHIQAPNHERHPWSFGRTLVSLSLDIQSWWWNINYKWRF